MAANSNNVDSPRTKGITVAVIGAGLAGIAAVKCSLDEGLNPTCFEQDDQIGTLIKYSSIDVSYLIVKLSGGWFQLTLIAPTQCPQYN